MQENLFGFNSEIKSSEPVKIKLNTIVQGHNRLETLIKSNKDIEIKIEEKQYAVDEYFCPQKDRWNILFTISFPNKPQYVLDEAFNGFIIVGRERRPDGADTEENPKGDYIIQRVKKIPNHYHYSYQDKKFDGTEPFTVDRNWFDEKLTDRRITWCDR
jgi:hypothetical protein